MVQTEYDETGASELTKYKTQQHVNVFIMWHNNNSQAMVQVRKYSQTQNYTHQLLTKHSKMYATSYSGTKHTNANDVWIQLWQRFLVSATVDGWLAVAVHCWMIKTRELRWQ